MVEIFGLVFLGSSMGDWGLFPVGWGEENQSPFSLERPHLAYPSPLASSLTFPHLSPLLPPLSRSKRTLTQIPPLPAGAFPSRPPRSSSPSRACHTGEHQGRPETKEGQATHASTFLSSS